jgi:hypothetical protein
LAGTGGADTMLLQTAVVQIGPRTAASANTTRFDRTPGASGAAHVASLCQMSPSLTNSSAEAGPYMSMLPGSET